MCLETLPSQLSSSNVSEVGNDSELKLIGLKKQWELRFKQSYVCITWFARSGIYEDDASNQRLLKMNVKQ